MTATSLLLLAQCLLALAAFASLCLATPRHIPQLKFAKDPQRWRSPLRWAGAMLMAITTFTAVISKGWALGSVDLFGALSLAAFIVIAFATYRPQWLTYVALVALTSGVGVLVRVL